MSIPEAPSSDARAGEATTWQRAHADLEELAHLRAGLDYEEGRCLLVAFHLEAHKRLGYASFVEYIERLFGYKPRWTDERVRVAEALEDLPELAQSLRDGAVSWSAVREITRVAKPETETEWLEATRDKSLRQVERMVAGRRPGDRPSTPPDPKLIKHVLHFEVTAATFATFREAMSALRREAGEKLGDDDALLSMARHVLQGPSEEGRASYQFAISTCDTGARGFQTAAGEPVELERGALERARCDAEHIGATHVDREHAATETPSPPKRAGQSIPPRVRRIVLRRDHGRCVVPGCTTPPSSTRIIWILAPKAVVTSVDARA